ncbi:unnamed protein product [Symbiodinium sp. KB8]|nr:unnamed protein product [Symbiodinium sp. KB8]
MLRCHGVPGALTACFPAPLQPAAVTNGGCRRGASTSVGPARIFDTPEELLADIGEPCRDNPQTLVFLHGVRFAPNVGASLRASHLLGAQGCLLAGGLAESRQRRPSPLEEAIRISMAARHGWPLRVSSCALPDSAGAVKVCAEHGYLPVCVENDTAGLANPPLPAEDLDLTATCS